MRGLPGCPTYVGVDAGKDAVAPSSRGADGATGRRPMRQLQRPMQQTVDDRPHVRIVHSRHVPRSVWWDEDYLHRPATTESHLADRHRRLWFSIRVTAPAAA